MDRVFIVNGIIDSCKKEKIKVTMVKVDFHKVYDLILWSFLDKVFYYDGVFREVVIADEELYYICVFVDFYKWISE